MDEFTAKVKEIAQEQAEDVTISSLAVGQAIEQFRTIRNYPSRYDDEKITDDMERYIFTIAARVVEIAAKSGADGQISHSENGTSRGYKEGSLAYQDLVGFVR